MRSHFLNSKLVSFAVHMMRLNSRRLRFRYRPKKGNNIVSTRTFSPSSTEPVTTSTLTWEQKGSVWFCQTD